MKKKMFFIVFAIIQFIAAIYIVVSAEGLTQELIEEYKQIGETIPVELMETEMQEEMQAMVQEMIQLVEERGVASLRVSAGLCILVNIGVLITAIRNRILRNKGLMIAAMIVSMLFGGTDIAILLAVIGLIILLVSKREKPEDFPEKKEIPVLEKIETNKREIIIGIVLAVVYFSQFIWGNYIPDSKVLAMVIEVVFYLTVIILSLLFFKKNLKRDLKTFKENFGTYIRFLLPRVGIMYLIYIIVTLIVVGVTGSFVSANQEGLESMPVWYVLPLALIYAPIVEETIFRGVIHKAVKNKYLFIVISAICFGLIHTITSEITLINIVVKALPYTVLGGFLAYVYDRTDNITTNMFCHFALNLFASLVTLL